MKKSHYSGKSIFVSKLLIVFIVTIGVYACQKKKQPEVSSPHELTKTEFFNSVAGHYKVFDSIGDLSYEMDIEYIPVSEYVDSLKFINFDGNFTFSAKQGHTNEYPCDIIIPHIDTIADTDGHQWTLTGATDQYYNNMHHDTLPLLFQKTNIRFWVSEAVPYQGGYLKQIAVKQH